MPASLPSSSSDSARVYETAVEPLPGLRIHTQHCQGASFRDAWQAAAFRVSRPGSAGRELPARSSNSWLRLLMQAGIKQVEWIRVGSYCGVCMSGCHQLHCQRFKHGPDRQPMSLFRHCHAQSYLHRHAQSYRPPHVVQHLLTP